MGFQRMRAYHQKLEAISKSWCGEKMERFTLTKLPKCCDLHETIECQRPDTIDASREGGAYHTWTMKHPSALKMFDQMMSGAKKKRIAVFLDYDGTLSPIVDEPDLAFMSEAMRSAVRDVAEHFPTAIISGRCRDKVYDFVQLQDVYYVGSHGMDIMVPSEHPNNCGNSDTKVSCWLGNEEVLFQPAKEFLPKIEEIYRALDERTMKIRGVLIENNKFCLSVHFRRVNREDWIILEEQVKDVLKDYPNFRLTWGRKVMEIRPCIKWDKGCALEYLLDTLGFGTDTDILPFYLGDDQTDEDAFKVLERRGQGFPIIVSSIPRDTKASFSLRDPSEVMSFLLRLAKWGRNFSASNSF
ncbi:probable trehalose-phosphate phosphatase C [Aristolochia californica]|uniref:probable trehalose-phosphate phosphatase C n=1 Tax=Aristolochia californica TaxID=171875 RepID=UPI0035DED193